MPKRKRRSIAFPGSALTIQVVAEASRQRIKLYRLALAVRVTDSKTSRSVIVVINNRGPFNKGRVLDLSTTAAKALDMMERGVVLVKVDVL